MARWLLLGGVAGPAVFIMVALVLGATRPGYDPTYTFVSQLSLDGGGAWQVANFVVSGTLIALAAVGLRSSPAAGGIARRGWSAVALIGVGLTLLGIFRDDPWLLYPPGAGRGIGWPVSPAGWGHLLSGFATFGAFEVGALSFARGLARAGLATARVACLVPAVAFPLVYGVALVSAFASWDPASPLGGYAGLFQRLALLTMLAWVAWVAIYFARVPDAPPGSP